MGEIPYVISVEDLQSLAIPVCSLPRIRKRFILNCCADPPAQCFPSPISNYANRILAVFGDTLDVRHGDLIRI